MAVEDMVVVPVKVELEVLVEEPELAVVAEE